MLRCLCAVGGWKKKHLAAMLKLVPHKLLYGGKRRASRP
jgi:hypothetical protein